MLVNTGTPIQNYADDAVTLAKWLDNGQDLDVYKINLEKTKPEEKVTNANLLRQFVLRRRKSEHLPELLESMYNLLFFFITQFTDMLMVTIEKQFNVYTVNMTDDELKVQSFFKGIADK